MSSLDIGIDLDNTIIDYDHVFAPVARKIGLLPADVGLSTKQAVKTRLLEQNDEQAWMRLQGQVYGRFIDMAEPHAGCRTFIKTVQSRGARVAIVSHKTRRGHFDPAGIDLWQAALDWLEKRGFFAAAGPGIEKTEVYFETSRQAKIARIKTLGCRFFIDDLPEVLNHPDFPPEVEPLWFAKGRERAAGGELRAFYTWSELMDNVERLL